MTMIYNYLMFPSPDLHLALILYACCFLQVLLDFPPFLPSWFEGHSYSYRGICLESACIQLPLLPSSSSTSVPFQTLSDSLLSSLSLSLVFITLSRIYYLTTVATPTLL